VGDLSFTALHVCILIGQPAWAWEMLHAVGFGWDGKGLAAWNESVSAHSAASGTFPSDTWLTLFRLLMVTSAPPGTIGTSEVAAWLPAPAALAHLDKAWFTTTLGVCSLLHLGARAYEHIGNEAAAAETAALCVANQRKRVVQADCECTRARIAARPGDLPGARRHFEAAAAHARAARTPTIEVVAAMGLRQWVPESAADADALIVEAAGLAEKRPSAFASLSAQHDIVVEGRAERGQRHERGEWERRPGLQNSL
jgi:hypothetical protein